MTRIHTIRLVTLLLVVAVVTMLAFGCGQKSVDPTTVTENVPTINGNSGDTTNTILGPNVFARLASSPRQAMQQECWYALNQNVWSTHASPSNNISNWAYLTNDRNAYNWIKSKMGMYASHWINKYDPVDYYNYWKQYYYPAYTACSFYQQIDAYACYGGQGRGMQCRSFARLIPYRSGVYQSDYFPSYSDAINDYYGSKRYTKPIAQCRVGDIIQTTWKNGHTAIVVRIVSGVEGQSVTAVEVVDSNYLGDEVIGRHIFYTSGSGVSSLSNYFAIDIIALGGR